MCECFYLLYIYYIDIGKPLYDIGIYFKNLV